MSWVDLSVPRTPGTSRGLHAYVATPATPGPWPGIVALHEVWGLDDVLRRQAEYLASLGYLVCAPDFYSEDGGVKGVRRLFADIAHQEGRAFADVEAARRWVVGHIGSSGRVGIIGFRLGGAFSLVLAARGFDAVSVNYGRVPGDLDVLRGACPIVGSYGGRDLLLHGAAARLEGALTEFGVPHDVKEYPDAGHSFLADVPTGPWAVRPLVKITGMGPDPVAATDAWTRIDAFFSKHLNRPGPPAAS